MAEKCPFNGPRPIVKILEVRLDSSNLPHREDVHFPLSSPMLKVAPELTVRHETEHYENNYTNSLYVSLYKPDDKDDVYVHGTFVVRFLGFKEGSYIRTYSSWLGTSGDCFFPPKLESDQCVVEVVGTVTVYGPPVDPDFSSMRQLVALCDAKLRAGGAVFPVHKVVLGARSPVFLAMFSDNPKPAATKSEVEIPVDCSAATFGVFLDAVYSGALPDLRADAGQLLHVLELADKYLVEAVRAECLRQLESVDAGSALAVVRAGLEQPFVPEAVTTKAIHAVLDNWFTVTASQEWGDFCAVYPYARAFFEPANTRLLREDPKLKCPFKDTRAVLKIIEVRVRCRDLQDCDCGHSDPGCKTLTINLGSGLSFSAKLKIHRDNDIDCYGMYYDLSVDLTSIPKDTDVCVYGSFVVGNNVSYKYGRMRDHSRWLQSNGTFFTEKYDVDVSMNVLAGTVTLYGPAVSPTGGSPKGPDFSSMRQLSFLCDAKLRAGGAVFPVHKVVLGARSPVFLAMFSDNPKPAATKSEVEIPVDCSAAAFGVFLDAVYSGALPDLRADAGQLLHVLELADKYLVEAVRAECLRQLESVDAGSALTVVRAGLEQPFVPEAVTTKAIHAVLDNWATVTASQEWVDFCAAYRSIALFLKASLAHRK